MLLKDFFDYKNLLMKEICCDPDIVKLVTGKDDSEVPNHTMAYTQVFPYEYVPETVDNGQTFICFDVDIWEVQNKTYYDPVLYVWIFTHKSKFRLETGGVRVDEIASLLDQKLNGSRIFGLGELNLRSVRRFAPITDYQGRVLTYETRDFNRAGQKQPPAHRKPGV